jgi:hypothetical protein
LKQKLKRAILNLLKVIAVIAAVMAIFLPLSTFDQVLIFFGSIMVGFACLVASSELDDDSDESLSIWPTKSGK